MKIARLDASAPEGPSRWFPFGCLAFAVAAIAVAAQAAGPSTARAALKDSWIVLESGGPAFRVPKSWLAWNERWGGNLHFTAEDLASVRDGSGEWDTEYGEIANALLPFEDLYFHGGADRWPGSLYNDLQMRAYTSRVDAGTAEERVHAIYPQASVSRASSDGWEVVTVSLERWYMDYGGTAQVELRTRFCVDRFVTLVFMRDADLDEPGEQQRAITKSFVCKR